MSTALTAPQSIQWDDESLVRTIQDTVCKNATPSEFRMFIEVCKATGLNPFLREIWYVKGVGIMAGRDGYLRKANEHPQFDGMETRVERDEKNVPIKAVCSVWRKDRSHAITCEAFFNEYRKGGPTWNQYPSAMIAKVAEVLALKRSFSINGVVAEEEIGNQEERGSREAQQEVAQRRIAELTPPAVSKETISELADQLNGPPAEPPLLAPPVKKPPRKTTPKNEMTEAAKAKWRQAKMQLRAVTGDDKAYYGALAPYKHCTEIATKEEATAIWKALQAALAPPSPREVKLGQKGDTALLLELSVYKQRFGDEEFARILGLNGFTSVDDFMVNANGIQTDTLLWDFKDRSRPQ